MLAKRLSLISIVGLTVRPACSKEDTTPRRASSLVRLVAISVIVPLIEVEGTTVGVGSSAGEDSFTGVVFVSFAVLLRTGANQSNTFVKPVVSKIKVTNNVTIIISNSSQISDYNTIVSNKLVIRIITCVEPNISI